MTERFEITPLRTDADLLTYQHKGSNSRLVICLSGVGKDSEDIPPYEFARSATENGQNHVLFVVDPNRTWLNGAGIIERILEDTAKIVDSCGITSICTLGHSMGGFAAIVLADFMEVDTVVSLAPQHSVHPDIAGNEHRWRNWVDPISDFRIRSVDDHWVNETAYHVIHGNHNRDKFQRDRFPIRAGLVHTILPDTTHAVPQRLKREGLLDQVVSLCLNNRTRRVRQLLEPMGAYRRTTENHPILGPSPRVVETPAAPKATTIKVKTATKTSTGAAKKATTTTPKKATASRTKTKAAS